MKPFHFGLETKLHISQLEEDQAREQLQQALSWREQCRFHLEDTVQQIENIEKRLVKMMDGSCDLDQLYLLNTYIPVLRKLKEKQEQMVAAADEKVEAARIVLLEKNKEVKILLRLKEKEWQEYLLEVNQEEQKIVDEIAITTHHRKKLS